MQVVILGSGIVGLTLANLLAKQNFNLILIEPRAPELNWDPATYDLRVSAITRASQHIFEHIGIWPAILAQRVAAYTHMQVWQANSQVQVDFAAHAIGEDNLGYIVENRILQATLYQSLLGYQNVRMIHAAATQLKIGSNANQILVGDQLVEAQLIVGADGANSWLRQAANLTAYSRDYGQKAIVATIHSAVAHNKTARQIFNPDSILAFLPLADPNLCSIVWSTTPDKVLQLLQADPDEFCQQLAVEFEQRLGALILHGSRAAFPLRMLHVENYIGPRIALVGDAAHVVHPLAGQGLNLGILDAAALAEVIVNARTAGQDIGAHLVLRKYERWRKGHNTNMLALIDGLKNICVRKADWLAELRNSGMQMVNQFDWLKNAMIRMAIGTNSGLPKYAYALQDDY